ncbi:MAG TPA: type I glyceraldehyde-3-phosphate dehydrogenase [Actinomycetota bacterium]|jgi:glyceraldehyde 3-phosphate dehydrogenase|nr:type I glyceraldehyde-3-phosphate dehydrogenase [Actinomycetota bacterium]
MTTRIGINGFGRIGRNFYRALKAKGSGLEVIAVNDLGDAATMAHLLKYDSVLGPLGKEVKVTEDGFSVEGESIRLLSQRDPADLPWGDLSIDVVIESTGFFTKRADAMKHLEGGAKKVIISAPAKDEDITIVMGVNDDAYDAAKHEIISNASCTTNCVVPLAKVLQDNWGIDKGFMTTCHAYTNDQNTLDLARDDLRRARAAAINIIPTTTGAAKASALAMPELKGRLDGLSLRVPVPDGSITDLVAILGAEVTRDQVNDAYREASQSAGMRGILQYTEDPIVSSDIVGNPHSCIIDGLSTMTNGNMVKVLGWYDNEWGYSNRLVDVAELIAGSI